MPNESFKTGIQKTIQWYLDNQNWWEEILDKKYKQERLGLL
jgi:dTDP-glucose 4,6-dehydratase